MAFLNFSSQVSRFRRQGLKFWIQFVWLKSRNWFINYPLNSLFELLSHILHTLPIVLDPFPSMGVTLNALQLACRYIIMCVLIRHTFRESLVKPLIFLILFSNIGQFFRPAQTKSLENEKPGHVRII